MKAWVDNAAELGPWCLTWKQVDEKNGTDRKKQERNEKSWFVLFHILGSETDSRRLTMNRHLLIHVFVAAFSAGQFAAVDVLNIQYLAALM